MSTNIFKGNHHLGTIQSYPSATRGSAWSTNEAQKPASRSNSGPSQKLCSEPGTRTLEAARTLASHQTQDEGLGSIPSSDHRQHKPHDFGRCTPSRTYPAPPPPPKQPKCGPQLPRRCQLAAPLLSWPGVKGFLCDGLHAKVAALSERHSRLKLQPPRSPGLAQKELGQDVPGPDSTPSLIQSFRLASVCPLPQRRSEASSLAGGVRAHSEQA